MAPGSTLVRLVRLPRWARISLLLAPAMLVVITFFVGGVAQALVQSLGYLPFLPARPWSLNAYGQVWTDPAVRASVWLTVRVTVLSTAAAAVLGVAAALTIRRLGRGRGAVAALFGATLAVPHLVAAVCMLLLLSQSGWLSRLSHAVGLTATQADFPALTNDAFGWGIIAAYVWKETPFIAVLALAALGRGADQLEDAARTLGAGPWQRLRHVTIPILAAPVAAGSVLVFAFAASSYEVPYLLGRPYPTTLPVVAYQLYRDTDLTSRPQAMAVALVIAALTMAVVAVYLRIVGRLSGRAL